MNAYVNPMNSVHLHLETDREFVARVSLQIPKVAPYIRDLQGEDLDDYVWNSCKMQRKLIWVNP